MKKFGLLTTSILLTISLAMYSHYLSEPVANPQQSKFIELAQQTTIKRRMRRSLQLFRSHFISKLCLTRWSRDCDI